jgi:hypothetical protein
LSPVHLVYATRPLHGGFAFPIFSFFQSYQIVHFLARARKDELVKRLVSDGFGKSSRARLAKPEE